MRTISVRLDRQADEQLRSICKRTGMSQTDAVKAGIAALVDRPRVDPHALAVQLGLVGCVEGEVDDLGVNHARYIKEKLTHRHRG